MHALYLYLILIFLIQFNQLCIRTTFSFHKLHINFFCNFKIHIIWFLVFTQAAFPGWHHYTLALPEMSGHVCWDLFIYIFFSPWRTWWGRRKRIARRTRITLSSFKGKQVQQNRDAVTINSCLRIFLSRNKNTTTYLQFPKSLVITSSHLILTTTTLWQKGEKHFNVVQLFVTQAEYI